MSKPNTDRQNALHQIADMRIAIAREMWSLDGDRTDSYRMIDDVLLAFHDAIDEAEGINPDWENGAVQMFFRVSVHIEKYIGTWKDPDQEAGSGVC